MKSPRLASSLALAAAALAFGVQADPGAVALRPFISGVSAPIDVVDAGNRAGDLYVVEQAGRIKRFANGSNQGTVLDISSLVAAGGEQGLLGAAFHPRYEIDGRVFVYYNRTPNPPNGGSEIVVASFQRVGGGSASLDPASRVERLVIQHPTFGNHNGGKLAFGPDGYLYIAVGDGGSGGDPGNNAQNLGSLLGKILRIDVDSPVADQIPADNPFVGQGGARGEVYAYGLRNPWRFSFDRATGNAYIADVGQDAWEELDVVTPAQLRGANFGWRVFEATHCYNPSTNCSLANHTPPVLEYGHNNTTGGFSITGGYVYRGPAWPEMRGHYFYADYVSKNWWAVSVQDFSNPRLLGKAGNISAFGEDRDGEIYIVDRELGTVQRIAAVDSDGDGMSDAFEAAHFGGNAGVATDDTDNDGIPNLYEYREVRDPLVKDNDVFNVARLFVQQQYRDFLGREGDNGGVDFWSTRLGSGATRADMARDFLESQEFGGFVAPVARLYFAYFLRIPDYAGLDFWMRQARSTSLTFISDSFAQSPEFQDRYGTLSNAQFVDRVYRNVLGRAPDSGGLAFWTQQLDNGLSRGSVMLSFSQGAEYMAASASRVAVVMTYAGMLRRAPDQAGFDFWVGYVNSGNSITDLISSFLASTEYQKRFLP